MIRLQDSQLLKLLSCPTCRESLTPTDKGLHCPGCHCNYGSFKGRPVLIAKDNPLFPPSSYAHSANAAVKPAPGSRFVQRLKSLVPSKSINLARERMFALIARRTAGAECKILVVGCGRQAAQLSRYFAAPNFKFVLCDVSRDADCDLYCDSHSLPFKDAFFDLVISTAVMEHVLHPASVAEEVNRVTQPGGLIYSEIPFLQSVHEGAYDFSRFTLSGHRQLMSWFEEVDAGMVAGPGTALVWSIVDFSGKLFSNNRASTMARLLAQSLFFWLKYFDHIFARNPRAVDAASCTYFYGVKSGNQASPVDIIQKYHASSQRNPA